MLAGKVIDRDNPAASVFFGQTPFGFYVLDSVVTSTNFTIAVDRASDVSFKLDIPAIQKLVGELNLGVSVSTSSGYDLTFKGTEQLAFAFSCVRFVLAEDGKIRALMPDSDLKVLSRGTYPEAAAGDEQTTPLYSPDRVLLDG